MFLFSRTTLLEHYLQSTTTTETTEQPKKKWKHHKYALLLGYNGAKYFGMQMYVWHLFYWNITFPCRNAEFPTVERELFRALHECDGHYLTSQQLKDGPASYAFQRAARTDKGVSAVRQVCSIQFRLTPEQTTSLKQIVEDVNKKLPEGMRLFLPSLCECTCLRYSTTWRASCYEGFQLEEQLRLAFVFVHNAVVCTCTLHRGTLWSFCLSLTRIYSFTDSRSHLPSAAGANNRAERVAGDLQRHA